MHRFQPKIDDDLFALDFSIRQVWCYPQRIIALEQYFFGEIIAKTLGKSREERSPIYISGLTNSEISDRSVKVLRNGMKRVGYSGPEDESVFSLDFSKYDSSLPDYMFDIFFQIVESQITFKNENEKKAFDLLRIYSKYTPYIHKGEFRLQLRGIGSGSKLTNLFDSWVNVTLWNVAEDIKVSKSPLYDNMINQNADFAKIEIPPDMILNKVFASQCFKYTHLKVCGDDTAIRCYAPFVELHRRLCCSIGLSISIYHKTDMIMEKIFFLGRFWNSMNEPFNTDLYITCHIIARTTWYVKEKVPFDVTKQNVEFSRILSICGQLSNGQSYISRTFYNWLALMKHIRNRKNFTDLTSWQNRYEEKTTASIGNWRLY